MRVIELDASEAHLRVSRHGALLLDCREPDELAIARIPGATHIPMGDIPASLERLPRHAEIIVFCHHGMRSYHTAQFLAENGYTNVSSLRGGIEAWSAEIDPSIPRY